MPLLENTEEANENNLTVENNALPVETNDLRARETNENNILLRESNISNLSVEANENSNLLANNTNLLANNTNLLPENSNLLANDNNSLANNTNQLEFHNELLPVNNLIFNQINNDHLNMFYKNGIEIDFILKQIGDIRSESSNCLTNENQENYNPVIQRYSPIKLCNQNRYKVLKEYTLKSREEKSERMLGNQKENQFNTLAENSDNLHMAENRYGHVAENIADFNAPENSLVGSVKRFKKANQTRLKDLEFVDETQNKFGI
jgi:hypothetical protein